ncbi:hypothetical protein P692DRAFT_20876370 [Suillus brevipes Sb2]|nr:hypothetical protein P692DRAFT_20876370 [Suillus brevipes Sb2]
MRSWRHLIACSCAIVKSDSDSLASASSITTSLFNFLSLHAAGEYRKHGQVLSQLYIPSSSYTPSLTALTTARRHDRFLSVSFAAIGQDHPPGASFTLDCVEPELELVRSLLPPPSTVPFTHQSL